MASDKRLLALHDPTLNTIKTIVFVVVATNIKILGILRRLCLLDRVSIVLHASSHAQKVTKILGNVKGSTDLCVKP